MEEFMVDKDIIYAKIGIIQRCLHRIKTVTKLNPDTLKDLDVQDVFVLNLQRAAQAAIDLAAHIVAGEGLGIPQDLKENFLLLEEGKIVSAEIAAKMTRMVGFRNIAVHEYQNLYPVILQGILVNHLQDLEDFYSQIIRHFKLA